MFVRHKPRPSRREMRLLVVAVLVGLMTAIILALVMIAEARKHAN